MSFRKTEESLEVKLFEPYQPQGVKWMLNREICSGMIREEQLANGGILADEVGLGKTIMTLGTILGNPKMNTLIIVPKSLVVQWTQEIQKFTQKVIIQIPTSNQFKLNEDSDIISITIIPHSRLNSRSITDINDNPFANVFWDRIVIDEAHIIKNKNSKIHKAVCSLNTDIRWALTATPIMNKMEDFIYTMKWIGVSQCICQNYKEEIVSEYILRRTKEDVKEFNDSFALPPCNLTIKRLNFDTREERILYLDAYSRLQKKLKYIKNNTILALELLLRIRQLCAHPQSFLDGIAKKNQVKPELWQHGSTKLRYIISKLKDQPIDDKTLIFCHFIKEMDIYMSELTEIGYNCVRLDGRMTQEERSLVVSKFNDDISINIFLIQINTGGQGYNFQAANRIFITTPTWNPALEHQVIGRSHRTGQKKEVFVTVLAIANEDENFPFIEEYILSLQDSKRKLISNVLKNTTKFTEIGKISQSITFNDVNKMFKKNILI